MVTRGVGSNPTVLPNVFLTNNIMGIMPEGYYIRRCDNEKFRKELAALLRKHNACICRMYDKHSDETVIGFIVDGEPFYFEGESRITPWTLD